MGRHHFSRSRSIGNSNENKGSQRRSSFRIDTLTLQSVFRYKIRAAVPMKYRDAITNTAGTKTGVIQSINLSSRPNCPSMRCVGWSGSAEGEVWESKQAFFESGDSQIGCAGAICSTAVAYLAPAWVTGALKSSYCRSLRHGALSPVPRSLPLVCYGNNLDPDFGHAKYNEVRKALH